MTSVADRAGANSEVEPTTTVSNETAPHKTIRSDNGQWEMVNGLWKKVGQCNMFSEFSGIPHIPHRRKPGAKRSVTILGDSVVKDIKPWRMREALDNSTNVFVKPNGGATVEDLHDHSRPVIRRDPSLIIVHGGTNSLTDRNKTADSIAHEIVHLATTCKQVKMREVAISSICIRADMHHEKGTCVNAF